MSVLKAVVVGCGAISPVHLNAINKSEFACVYGVCDILPEKSAQFKKQYNCIEFNSFEDVLSDDNVDCVHICTPHYLHKEMLVGAVVAGKKVVIEKPIVMNITELEDAKKAVNEYNVPVCSVIQNRYNPCVRKLKEIISNGTYGKILGLKGFIAWNRPPKYYQDSNWRGKKETEGGGLVINQALHTLDLLCYLGGNPEYIKATMDNRVLTDIIEVEDTAEATIFLENGILAHFYATNNYSTNACYDIEVNLEECSLRYIFGSLYLIEKDGLKIIEKDEIAKGEKCYWGKSHEILINNFYSNLAGKGGEYTDFQDSTLSVGLIDALYKSAETGDKVKIF